MPQKYLIINAGLLLTACSNNLPTPNLNNSADPLKELDLEEKIQVLTDPESLNNTVYEGYKEATALPYADFRHETPPSG